MFQQRSFLEPKPERTPGIGDDKSDSESTMIIKGETRKPFWSRQVFDQSYTRTVVVQY